MSKNKVINNASWIIVTKIFQMLIGIFVTAITARYLGPSNYGLIEYIGSFVAFFSSLANLGINNTIVKELIDNKDAEGEVLGTAILLRVVASFLSIICLFAVVVVVNKGDKTLIIIAILQGISMLLQAVDTINYWYQSKLQSKITSIIATISYLVVVCYRIYILIAQKDVFWFACNTTFDAFVIAGLLLYSYKKNASQKLSFSLKRAKGILSRSYHFIFSSLMIAIYGQMDKVMLANLIDNNSVAQYSIAVGVSSLWNFILIAIIDTFYPLIVEAKQISNEFYIKRLKQQYCIIIWLSIMASLFITVFAQPIILILYGEQYVQSIACLRIATWFTGFAYLGSARNAWMVSENLQKYQKYILFIGCVANIILNSLLIPLIGINGAAIATLITQAITSIIGPMLFKKTRKNSIFILQSLNPMQIIELLKEKAL